MRSNRTDGPVNTAAKLYTQFRKYWAGLLITIAH